MLFKPFETEDLYLKQVPGEQRLPWDPFFLRTLSDFGIIRLVAFAHPGNREEVKK